MKTFAPFVAWCVMSICLAGCGRERNVLATVAGETITVKDLQAAVQDMPDTLRVKVKEEKDYRGILDRLIEQKVLVARAKELGLDRDPTLEKEAEEYRNKLMVRALLEREMPVEPREEDLRAYYESHETEFGGGERIKLREIVIRVGGRSAKTRKEAKKVAGTVRAALREGRGFEELARQRSDGPTAEKGGDLGFVDPAALDDSIRIKVLETNNSGFSDPIETPAGFQIYQVVERRRLTPVPYEDVRNEIQRRFIERGFQASYQAYLAKLKHDLGARLSDINGMNLASLASEGK